MSKIGKKTQSIYVEENQTINLNSKKSTNRIKKKFLLKWSRDWPSYLMRERHWSNSFLWFCFILLFLVCPTRCSFINLSPFVWKCLTFVSIGKGKCSLIVKCPATRAHYRCVETSHVVRVNKSTTREKMSRRITKKQRGLAEEEEDFLPLVASSLGIH